MLAIILVYGIIAGAIVIASMLIGLALGGDAGASVWAGYLIMLAGLSLVFVGIKRYRDRELGGVIRFGTAFKLGIGIAVAASVAYVIGWEINLALTDYRFIDQYAEGIVEAKRAAGASAAEIAKTQAEMATLKAQFANPAIRVGFTLLEILPVGLVVALVSAALLRNSKLLPART